MRAKRKFLLLFREKSVAGNALRYGIDRALSLRVKRLLLGGLTAAAILTAGHTSGSAQGKLQLQLSPTITMAPAYVTVRAIVEHNSENRMLEIVADSASFYRRSVVDLDGDRAPKVNELRLIDIPGGEYDVSATLYDMHGDKTVVRRTLMVSGSH